MDFFRRIRISGFVDGYYTYNWPAPQPCDGGRRCGLNCLYSFNVAHNSLSLNLAISAREEAGDGQPRRLPSISTTADHLVHAFEPGGTTIPEHRAGLRQLPRYGGCSSTRQIRDLQARVIGPGQLELLARPALLVGDSYYHTGPRFMLINDTVSVTASWSTAGTTRRNNTGKTIGSR